MTRRLIGRWRNEKSTDPWTQLVKNSAAGIRDANDVIEGIVDRAGDLAEKISGSKEPVALLSPREAEDKWEEMLSGVERELRRMCGLYDYRQLLFVSRLCSGIPALRARDSEMGFTRVRSQRADRWVFRCADRGHDQDNLRLEHDAVSVGELPDKIFRDAVKLHVVSDFHSWLSTTRTRYNFARLVSARNDIKPGPVLRLRTEGRINSDAHDPKMRLWVGINSSRYRMQDEDFALWGMISPPSGDPHDALAYGYHQNVTKQPYGGGTLLAPHFMSLDTLFEYGVRFRRVFERDDGIGMPPEHLLAITRALRDLMLPSVGLEDMGGDERLIAWAFLTGTLPVPREVLVEALEEFGQQELAAAHPEHSGDDLAPSIQRFIALASPPSDLEGEALQVAHAKRETHAGSDRTVGYPYMIHGSTRHELLLVDFVNIIPFYQSLASQLEFSETDKTTGSGKSDSYERTSVFDERVAEILASLPDVELAFQREDPASGIVKEDPGLPPVTFRLPGGGNREIDVPLRYGSVLVAVQTWAREVDLRIDEGDYKKLQKRWNDAKEKLERTDRYYTDYLLCNPAGRHHMETEGLKYILPVLCGPFTEPVVSVKDEFWLRYPDVNSSNAPQESIPRILTPSELEHFLSTTSEDELIDICQQYGWRL